LGGNADAVWIEEVHGWGKDGAVGAFSFGRASGLVEAAAHACGITPRFVAPAKWKPALHCTADKNVSRAMAKRLFPGSAKLFARAMDDGRAEAALIAYYGLQQQYDRPKVAW